MFKFFGFLLAAVLWIMFVMVLEQMFFIFSRITSASRITCASNFAFSRITSASRITCASLLFF